MREQLKENEERLLKLIADREEEEANKCLGAHFERLDELCAQASPDRIGGNPQL